MNVWRSVAKRAPDDAGAGAMPAPAVATKAPADMTHRQRIDGFRARLDAEDFDALQPLVAGSDPFVHGALFAAVDHLLYRDRTSDLPKLEALAAHEPGFPQTLWRRLCDAIHWDPRALRKLSKTGADLDLPWRYRISSHNWALVAARPFFDPAAAPGDTGSGPAIVQFWDDPEIPDDIAVLTTEWRDLAQGNYTLFDAALATEFLQEAFGPDAAQIFQSCPHPAIQADYFRLGYLAINGGMYVDADARMRPDFPAIWCTMSGQEIYRFRSHVPKGAPDNSFMVARPGSPLMHAAFAEAGKRLSERPDMPVLWLAGPFLLRDVLPKVAREGGLDDVQFMTQSYLNRHVLGGAALAYKKDGRNWKTWQANQREAAE